jgi:uncharacterized protein
MIDRKSYSDQIDRALTRSPVTALLGPRQCGKTTLARSVAAAREASYFDLESAPDLARLQNPELALAAADGLLVIDEIQRVPDLFAVIRVLVDREARNGRFLILGSASPHLIRRASESLAGRVEFVDLAGFNASEVPRATLPSLWMRGGFPRSFLAGSEDDSFAWREGFLRTFLERDIPQLGLSISAPAMRRFWTMLAHGHGQVLNSSSLARSMGLSDKTVRSYLDILTDTFMVRQLQPWHVNVRKRQVKSPKTYLRDSGLLHSLLGLPDLHAVSAHPVVGASWEGFIVEQVLQTLRPAEAYFWATYQGAELDLLFTHEGRRYGIEIKNSEAPRITKSSRVAIEDLQLEHLWVIYPGDREFPIDEKIDVLPASAILSLAARLD